jgi:hypothetical protein
MVSKAYFKKIFQSSLKEMRSREENQKNDKNKIELDDESFGHERF